MELPRVQLTIDNKAFLGKGTFGEVYKGEWLGTEVAVKRLNVVGMDKDLADSFLKEANVMRQLGHPKIVQFLGVLLVLF